ncbi:MAG: 6-carboxytetrahydropterin synthase QueD [Planctomycetes bacterium]|nr:6-carboxytetrahydropterin synthase QueD [Planctomycetota bacterium]
MFYLQVEDHFASAHQLREYKGKCENLHGHNWRVRIKVKGEQLDRLGMLMDFGDLKRILAGMMDALDHKFLNDTAPFDRINPTSENLAKYLFEQLAAHLPDKVVPAEVTVWESERSAATYAEE